MSQYNYPEMNLLPDELLLEIFKYVPSKERRRSVRLVCRRWDQVAGDRIFTKREIITVNFHQKFDNALSNLTLSRRETININFLHQEFGDSELRHPFWGKCGNKVRSLVFDECVLSFQNMKRMIFQCSSLEHVSLLCDSYGLDKFIENFPLGTSYTAKSVTSFSLRIFCHSFLKVTYDIMSKILATFPNLEELKIAIHSCHNYERNPEFRHGVELEDRLFSGPFRLLSAEKSPLTAIGLYILARSTKIKKLWLMQPNSTYGRNEVVEFSNVLSQLKNLEELTVIGHQFLYFDINNPGGFLISNLPMITVLSLSCIPPDRYIFDILEQVLNKAPNLRVLQLESISCLIYNEPLLIKLLSSKLKKFHLNCTQCSTYLDTINYNFDRFPINCTLEELVIFESTEGGAKLFSLISPFLKKLRYLALTHPNDTSLQTIFKYQKCLKSLMLERSEKCTDFGFTGRTSNNERNAERTYSIRELKDLEYLSVRNMNLRLITNTTPLVFVLPKLKQLEIRIFEHCTCQSIKRRSGFFKGLVVTLKKHVLQLEALHLRVPVVSDLPMMRLKELLKPLKELHYFSLTFKVQRKLLFKPPNYEEVNELFDVRPSLRCIEYDQRAYFQQRFNFHGREEISISHYPSVFPKPSETFPPWSTFSHNEPEYLAGLVNIRMD